MLSLSSYSPERGRGPDSNSSHRCRGVRGTFRPRRHSAIFTHRNHSNVFVESCCAHGAHGNGPAFPSSAPGASRRREQRASEGRSAHFSHEQEVLGPRPGSALLPNSLIRQPTRSAIDRIRDDVRQQWAACRRLTSTSGRTTGCWCACGAPGNSARRARGSVPGRRSAASARRAS